MINDPKLPIRRHFIGLLALDRRFVNLPMKADGEDSRVASPLPGFQIQPITASVVDASLFSKPITGGQEPEPENTLFMNHVRPETEEYRGENNCLYI